MKRFILGFMVLGLLFSGCTSAGVLGVLTTNEILEAKIAESEAKQKAEAAALQAELKAELKEAVDKLASQIDEIHETARELNNMVDTISETAESTRQLQELAKVIEQRLNNLPMETLQGIVDILNRAVENGQ